ncbi:MAG: hypothetical protein ACI9EB_001720 [Pseudomonas sp.]|jgi:hypothetical protein
MNQKIIKYQFTLFSKSSAIEPTPENIKRSIDLFMTKGFMPSSVQETDPLTGLNVPRLSMQSSSNGVVLNFLSNRIDIVKILGFPGATSCGSLEEFIEIALDVSMQASAGFQISFNRMALIVDYMVVDLNVNQFLSAQGKLLPNVPLMGGGDLFEWDARFVEKARIGDANSEIVNIISSMGRHLIQEFNPAGMTVTDGLMGQVDINTLAENTEQIFTDKQCRAFYADAIAVYNRLNALYLGYINS